MDVENQKRGCLGRLAVPLGAVIGVLVMLPFALPALGAVAGSAALVAGMMLLGAVVMIPVALIIRCGARWGKR